MAGMTQRRPGVQTRRRRGRPAVARERAEGPRDFASALRQPGENSLPSTIRSRGAGAEVAHPFGLNTGPEDRCAWNRFQAARPNILRMCGVTNRHIVPSESYTTTGGSNEASGLIDPMKVEAPVAQTLDDLGQRNRVLRLAAHVHHIDRAGRGQAQTARDDIRGLAAAPAERVDGPADFVGIAGGPHVGGDLGIVVAVWQAIPGLRRVTHEWGDDRVGVLELRASAGRRQATALV